jgi:hypothetical protein
LFENSAYRGTLLLGISLQLTAAALTSLRLVFDELMMKKRSADPTFVVGWEGVYSTLILGPALFILWLAIPGKQGGSFENLPDTFYRIGESPVILFIISTLPLVELVLALAGAWVTKLLSAVETSLISVSRCALILIIEITAYYTLPSGLAADFGTPVTVWTPLKFVGFGLVIFSGLVYSRIIKLPRIFKYSQEIGETKPPII